MSARVFLDSNVLLYFLSKAPSEKGRAARAAELLMRDDVCLSTQVLAEVYVNATRKAACKLPHAHVMAFLEALRHLPTVSLTAEQVVAAAEFSHQRSLSYWDAAIVVAAQSLGCSTLFTEDLQHGQRFGSLRVVNPFL